MKMNPPIEVLIDRALDITAPEEVQVEWDPERRVLYVHIQGITVLRCCRVQHMSFKDNYTGAMISEL